MKYTYLKLLITTIVVLTFLCCQRTINNPETKILEIPFLKNLSDLKKTSFLPTLEHPISKNENAIYCSSLLLSWDELKDLRGQNLIISDKYPELQKLNESLSHKNSLKKPDYQSEIKISL